MMACAFTGPISGSASSSSFDAVLIFTAASANAEKSSVTSSSTNLFIFASERVDGRAGAGVCRSIAGHLSNRAPPAMLRVDARLGKQARDAARNALFHGAHGRGVARGAQTGDVRLGVALVMVGEPRREGDVLDCACPMQRVEWKRRRAVRPTAGVDRRRGDRIERRRGPAADIEYSGAVGMVEEIQIHIHDVFHADEITPLVAGRIAPRPLEKLHLTRRTILLEKMPDHRRHALLVRLTRTIHVEVAETRDLRRPVGEDAAHVLIEQQLRVAVDVERRFAGALLPEGCAASIHRGGGSIEEWNVVFLAMMQQRDGVAEIIREHVAGVDFHRVRARALVNERGDVILEVAVCKTRQELVFVEVVGDLAIDEVLKPVVARKAVDGDDLRLAASVQRFHEVGSDEAGRAGDDDVHLFSSLWIADSMRARSRARYRPCRSSWRRTAPAEQPRTKARNRPCSPRPRRRRPEDPNPTARRGFLSWLRAH